MTPRWVQSCSRKLQRRWKNQSRCLCHASGRPEEVPKNSDLFETSFKSDLWKRSHTQFVLWVARTLMRRCKMASGWLQNCSKKIHTAFQNQALSNLETRSLKLNPAIHSSSSMINMSHSWAKQSILNWKTKLGQCCRLSFKQNKCWKSVFWYQRATSPSKQHWTANRINKDNHKKGVHTTTNSELLSSTRWPTKMHPKYYQTVTS